MEKKLNVDEIYQCLGLLSGFSQKNPETQKQESVVLGFANEKGISEGMRRIANKTIKKLNENYPSEQIKSIQSLDFSELYNGKLPEGYTPASEDILKLTSIKEAKLKDLISDEVIITFDELPDFKMLDDRLEERKEVLSHDYTYLFDKLFLNY